MRDVVHPDVELPSTSRIRAHLEKGEMMLDLLLNAGTPVAYTRAHLRPRAQEARPDRKALEVDEPVAALEIDYVTCRAEGAPVEHSTDTLLLRSPGLHVMRWLEDMPPVPAIGRGPRG